MLGKLEGKTVVLLGLAFKPNTDDMRDAPSLKIIPGLQKGGARIRAYDPKAAQKTAEEIPDIFFAASPYQAAEGTEALILATEWPEFRDLDWKKIRGTMVHPFIFDGRNFLDPVKLRAAGFRYEGMGRPG
jgi:UDPglucose 6-dehydrogenase